MPNAENDAPTEVETRTTHYYEFYGRTLTGYGPSMDPHRCGDPSEPCRVVVEQRAVTPWRVVETRVIPPGGGDEAEPCVKGTPGCAVGAEPHEECESW